MTIVHLKTPSLLPAIYTSFYEWLHLGIHYRRDLLNRQLMPELGAAIGPGCEKPGL